MCRLLRITLMSFLVMLMWGCIPYSDSPLTDPLKEPLDQSLCGTWFAKDKDETVYLHVGVDFESKLLRLTMIDMHSDNKIDVSQFIGHTSKLGGDNYLNLRWAPPTNEPGGFMFVKYRAAGDILGISLSKSSVLIDAVKKGLLKGTIDGQSSYADVRIAEDPERLRKFVAANAGELFDEMHYLQRLHLADGKL